MRSAAVIMLWLTLLTGVFAWPFVTGSATVGDDLTRRTVWVALAYYAAAAWLMLGLGPADLRAETLRGRFARWCWTLGWGAFVFHVGAAFHFYHHWSHAEAVEHVRGRSGVGEGVFASYVFALAWTSDVAWWWLRPESYAARPAWVGRGLHLYMFLMVFFATVVYEEGPIRWMGLVLCGGLALRWLFHR